MIISNTLNIKTCDLLPLQKATCQGNYQQAKHLISIGTDVNLVISQSSRWQDYRQDTPLCFAAHKPINAQHHENRLQILTLLINTDADINKPGVNDNTPMHKAVLSYNIQALTILLAANPDLSKKNVFGHTPLDSAKKAAMNQSLHPHLRKQSYCMIDALEQKNAPSSIIATSMPTDEEMAEQHQEYIKKQSQKSYRFTT